VPQPDEVAALSLALREAFQAAQQWLDEQEASILTDPTQWRKRARLSALRREVAQRMADLDALSLSFFERSFPLTYQFGAQSAASSLGVTFGWSQLDIDAVTVLARQGLDDLLRATKGVTESTKALIRHLARRQALLSLTVGTTAKQAGRDLAKMLAQRGGLTAITYRNGARHSLGDYSSMVIQTVTGSAMNQGSVNQTKRMGVRYVHVFDGYGDAPCAAVANTYQTVEWAEANLLGHPRCQRSVSPAPWIETPEGARTAEQFVTPEQRADQAASEQARADANRRRAQRRAAQRRAEARAGR
jgi:hypothetical protein